MTAYMDDRLVEAESLLGITQLRSIAEGWGWQAPANVGEFRVIRSMRALGVGPKEVKQQFRLGPYRIDFAFPSERVAIEADGWVHTAASTQKRDRARDKSLAEWGWDTYRINIDADVSGIHEAVIAAVRIGQYRCLHCFTKMPPGGPAGRISCDRCRGAR